MHVVLRHEDSGADGHLGPLAFLEESELSVEHMEPLVFVRVVVWRRAVAGRRNFDPLGVLAAGGCDS